MPSIGGGSCHRILYFLMYCLLGQKPYVFLLYVYIVITYVQRFLYYHYQPMWCYKQYILTFAVV